MTEKKRIFRSKEITHLLSLSKTTSLNDVRAFRDNFKRVGHGEYMLNEGSDLNLLIEQGKKRASKWQERKLVKTNTQ